MDRGLDKFTHRSPYSNTAPFSKDDVAREIKQNYELALMCVLPGIESRVAKIQDAARQIGIESTRFERYRRILLEAEVWKINGTEVISDFELLELGELTIQDHLSMTLDIISRLSPANSHEYEHMALASNREVVRKFLGKVRQALKELYTESKAPAVKKDCVFSWTQTGVVHSDAKEGTGNETL